MAEEFSLQNNVIIVGVCLDFMLHPSRLSEFFYS